MIANNEIAALTHDGYVVLPTVLAPHAVEALADQLQVALASQSDAYESIRTQSGGIYAARNVLTLWPEAARVWRTPLLLDALRQVLGLDFGLVRVLFFDKPPERTWALPWHKDMTIAVREHGDSPRFGKPTRKAGIPHVEAPVEVLEQMLTVRMHLDDVDDENGPLKVIPGSHRTGKELILDGTPPVSIHARRGDALLICPLVAHCSNKSHPDTRRHRRILHFEFAASSELPDGYAWHDFIAAGADSPTT
jgi:hypothetical protein